MTDDSGQPNSKKIIQQKLFISILSTTLLFFGLSFIVNVMPFNFLFGALGALLIAHSDKIPRFIALLFNDNVEVFTSGFSFKKENRSKSLPIFFTILIALIILMIYLFYIVLSLRISIVLIGLSFLLAIFNNRFIFIIFDYKNQVFYGLWNSRTNQESVYFTLYTISMDKQPMNGTILQDEETVKGFRMKVTDRNSHYFVSKKRFSDDAWNRILVNARKINALNQ